MKNTTCLALMLTAACSGSVVPLATRDAGVLPTDAGPPFDASVQLDAGAMDAGAVDAGAFDAGLADAGSEIDAGTEGDGDFTIDMFSTQPELTDKGAPRGLMFSFVMDSNRSRIFDGKDATLIPSKPRSLTRQIQVYIPANYIEGTEAPLMIIQDGSGPIDAISYGIDNLSRSADVSRRIPAFIAIAVQNGGDDAQGSERGLEYDTMSDRYARFIELEVLPAVLADSKIKAAHPMLRFTRNPEGRATYGCSSGAAAAFTMAWYRPDLFRRAITYSGTFVAQQNVGQPETPVTPLGAWEYHSSLELIANTPRKPIRVFLNVNENDFGSTAPESGHHNWVMANQRMSAALGAKGYHRRFVFGKGLGHCDGPAWQSTLADTLVWVWRGYPN
jgi:iron(III)-enterobactin esterase